MIRRTSLILALALAASACSGSDSGPVVITDLEQMRVVKVSGDQSSPVPDAAPSQVIYATAGASLQAAPGEGWTAEPLVARVEASGVASRGTGPGPVIQPGTLVHWQIPEGAGQLYGQTTATDDSAYVVNRWAPGTRAGTYQATAGRILADGTITDDATWELVVEPGAPYALVGWQVPERYPIRGTTHPRVQCDDCITVLEVGDTLDFREWWREDGPWVEDEYGNEIALSVILGEYTPSMLAVNGAFLNDGEEATWLDIDSAGWTMIVPNEPGFWNLVVNIGPKAGAANFVEIRPAP